MPVAVFRPGPTPAAALADGRPGHGAVVRLAGLIITLSLGAPTAAQDFTTLKGHGGPIMGIAVAPDGRIATASFDNSVGLWQDGVPGWLERCGSCLFDDLNGLPAQVPCSVLHLLLHQSCPKDLHGRLAVL